MKELFIIAYCYLLSTYSFCQTGALNVNEGNTIESRVTDMVKQGNTPVIGYTGNFNFGIPLCDLKVNSLQDNINLSYNSTGFFPNKRDGEVGVNWSLNYGGMITRSTNGVPDENHGDPTNGNGNAHGIYYQGSKLAPTTDFNNFNNLIFNLSSTVLFSAGKEYGGRVRLPGAPNTTIQEMKSDVFTFNFSGVSGKFYFNASGKPIVITNNNEKILVDLTYFGVPDGHMPAGYYPDSVDYVGGVYIRSKIRLILDNGFIYEFGGSINNLAYVINNPTLANNPLPYGINTWYLARVISPNGDELIYEYDRIKIDLEGSFITDPLASPSAVEPLAYYSTTTPISVAEKSVFNNNINRRERTIATGGIAGYFGGTTTEAAYYETTPITEYLKGCYIRKIYSKSASANSNLFKIYFYYERPDWTNYSSSNISSFYKNPDSNYNPFGRKLNQIKVYTYNDVLVKKFDFIYTVAGTIETGSRKFLNEIKLNDVSFYKLDYYDITSLPSTTTKGVDFWGFWNGNPDEQYLVPSFLQNAAGDLTYTNAARNPSTTLFSKGMLSKVTYATKGFTEFTYENHDYTQRLERRSPNFLTSLYLVDGIAGGARIKQIKDYDGITYYNIRDFSYKKDDGTSSGILLDFPRYYFYIYQRTSDSSACFEQWRNTSYNSNSNDGSYITYSQMTETTSDNFKIKQQYSNYETNPDINDIHTLQLTSIDNMVSPPVPPFYLTPSLPHLYQNFVGVQFNDQSIERGRLIKETKLNSSGSPVEETEFAYNKDPDRFNKFIPNLKGTGGVWIQSYKIYTYPNYLTQKKTTSYFNGIPVIKTIDYEHGSLHNYPTMITESTSISNESVIKKFFYSLDTTMATEPFRSELNSANIVRTPLKTETYKGTEKLAESKTVYTKDATTSNLLLPKYIWAKKGNDSDSPNLEKKITFNQYDNKGNVQQYTPENGTPVTIIWGYNQTQPIAKIENATYSQVSSFVINLQTLSNTGSEVDLQTALDAMRINTLLVNAMVTTYTYKPLIGVSTITDPKGDTQYYNYDSFGRLQNVKDKNGNILSENQYHYKN